MALWDLRIKQPLAFSVLGVCGSEAVPSSSFYLSYDFRRSIRIFVRLILQRIRPWDTGYAGLVECVYPGFNLGHSKFLHFEAICCIEIKDDANGPR
jgi:hypothetical protein